MYGCVWPVICVFHGDPRVTVAPGPAVPSVLTKLDPSLPVGEMVRCRVKHTHTCKHTHPPDTPMWHQSTEGLSRLNCKHTHTHTHTHKPKLPAFDYNNIPTPIPMPPVSALLPHTYPITPPCVCDSRHLLQHTQPPLHPPTLTPVPAPQLPKPREAAAVLASPAPRTSSAHPWSLWSGFGRERSASPRRPA